jgi:hypothetical protein
MHLHQFSHSEDGVSNFLRSIRTNKESYVVQKPKAGLLSEQHTVQVLRFVANVSFIVHVYKDKYEQTDHLADSI